MSLITTQGCNIKSQNQNINFRQSGISVPAPNLIDNSIKRNSNITPLQADRVEISANSKKKKKKLSGFQKFAIGLGVLAGTGLVCLKGGHIYCKSAIKKAFKESQLKEHIDFKIANTIEEAREFTVKELGIKEVDKDGKINVYNNGATTLSFTNAKNDLNINIVKSTANLTLTGGSGNDTITVQDGAKIQKIDGGKGNDIIINNALDNDKMTLAGGAGNDIILKFSANASYGSGAIYFR